MNMKAICITYTDERSIHNDAMHDLRLGAEHGILACSATRLNKAQAGDLVILKANYSFLIGRLITPAPEKRNTWLDQGGEPWRHCWTYTPLTHILSIDTNIEKEVKELCFIFGIPKSKSGESDTNIFSARSCPNNAFPVLEELAKRHPIAKT